MLTAFIKRTKHSALLCGAVFIAVGFTLTCVNSAIAFDEENGKKLYNEHCTTCHGVDGRPITPGTPDFSRREGLIKTDDELFNLISYGVGIMPGYIGIISDEGIRDLILFMRFNF